MTPEAFLLLVAGCGLSLPPTITPDRLRTYAQAESGLDPAAISRPNRNGSRDYGLMQVSSTNFARFGVDAQTVMEPCTNLRVGAAILADADRAAACIYNTGRAACRNGYPQRIEAAAARQAGGASLSPAPAASAPPPPPPHSWDVWAVPAPEPAPPASAESAEEPRVIVELQSGD